ncbi:SRPBCC domain-containing protein [Nocardioides pantholopis]|uniref:SRPBCC domain-containing protein n=1 Tax=Nocardioides pantholopis TaxID=2483798 RepID=UPI000F08897D|nr:SRPBCC domain-containing protein [Nocardioides pantholopis]
MDHVRDTIDREVYVDAAPATVWQVITRPEHVRRWFGDDATFVAEPGAEGTVGWDAHGEYPLRVELVEPTTRFAFRWIRRTGVDLRECSTLVEFELVPEGRGTRLRVTESGFASLPWPPEERTGHAEENAAGWQRELEELVAYVATLPAEPGSGPGSA